MNWTISRRIVVGFALGLGLVVLVGAVGILAVQATARTYEGALKQERETVVLALRVESEFRRAALDYAGFLSQPNDPEARSRDSTLSLSRHALESLRDSAPADRRATWVDALAAMQRWDEASAASIAALRAGREAEALRIRTERTTPARDEARIAIRRGVDEAEGRAEAALLDSRISAARFKTTLLIGGLLALAVGAISAFLLNRAVAGQLRETTGVLASTAAEILAATTQQASGASESSAAVAETVATVDEVAQTAEQARRARRGDGAAGGGHRAGEPAGGGGIVAAMAAVKEQVEAVAGEHPGPGGAGPGDRRDHRHGERHRRADQPAGAERRGRGGAGRGAGPRLRGGGGGSEEPGGAVEEGDRGGAADPGRDPAGHQRGSDGHRARHQAGGGGDEAGDGGRRESGAGRRRSEARRRPRRSSRRRASRRPGWRRSVRPWRTSTRRPSRTCLDQAGRASRAGPERAGRQAGGARRRRPGQARATRAMNKEELAARLLTTFLASWRSRSAP